MSLPADYYLRRTQKVLERLDAHGKADGILISQPRNVSYLSGFSGSDSWVLIGRTRRYLITDCRYAEQAQKEAKDYRIALRDRSTIFETIGRLAREAKIKNLCFESHAVSHQFFLKLGKAVAPVRLVSSVGLIEMLREQKDRYELEKIDKAVSITITVFEKLKKFIKVGMTESQVQNEFEYQAKAAGAQKTSFDIIVAHAAASSMPHYSTKRRIIGPGKPLLMDIGVVFDGYCSDLTRNLFFGNIPVSYLRMYRAVLEAQEAAIRAAVVGAQAGRVDAVCRQALKRHRLERYFSHATGHGVGLEVHESPSISRRSRVRLREGMVVTIEPGVYRPGRFGIRIEDMILVGSPGARVLTTAAAKAPETLRIG